MKIGFDAKRFLRNQTGLGNYSRTWIKSLIKADKSIQIQLFANNGKFPNLDFPLYFGKRFYYRSWGMGLHALKEKCDIFHGLSNEIPIDRANIPMVCTIHDVIFKQFPSHYKWIDRQIYDFKTRYACIHAQAIIVTSETTKNELLKYYRTDESKIKVIYQTIDPAFENAQWNPNLNHPYIFYHSTFNDRKNQINLINAFGKVKNKLEFDLVLAGTGKNLESMKHLIDAQGLNGRVRLMEAPSTDELISMLGGAAAFIYPSFQEGFGIPLVEAAYFGMPILASNIEIFKELLGSQAFSYFDPYSIEEMSNNLLELNQKFNSNFTPIDYTELKKKTSLIEMQNTAINLYKAVLGRC